MSAVSFADYAIVAVVFLFVALRCMSDVRDIIAAKSIKNTMRAIVKQKFSPRLTVLIPLESLENTKQTIQHLNEFDFPLTAIVVINSATHPSSVGALRYYVRRHAIKQVTVTARKNPNLASIAGEYAKTGLAVVLPDTARLRESFYYDAILLFGDKSVDAVQIVRGIRPGKTILSGFEVLITAWRQYSGSVSLPSVTESDLAEGVIIRATYIRAMPSSGLRMARTRRPTYDVSALENAGLTWRTLQQSATIADYGAVLIATSLVALLYNSSSAVLAIGVVALMHGAMVWWSLSTLRVSWPDRVSIMLLSPFFYVAAWSFLIAAGVIQVATLYRSLDYRIRLLRA